LIPRSHALTDSQPGKGSRLTLPGSPWHAGPREARASCVGSLHFPIHAPAVSTHSSPERCRTLGQWAVSKGSTPQRIPLQHGTGDFEMPFRSTGVIAVPSAVLGNETGCCVTHGCAAQPPAATSVPTRSRYPYPHRLGLMIPWEEENRGNSRLQLQYHTLESESETLSCECEPVS
jgi:hypothetical protein